MLQKTALSILKSGQNVFLTGSAGAGKTYVLNQYIQYLRSRRISVAITASTGIAATHIGGQTIHSWSGMGIKEEITDRDIDRINKKKPVRDRLKNTQVLIIDEVSMLSQENLHCVDQILRCFRDKNISFGGMQVIFSGDFFQLPPVSKDRLPSHQRFCFMSPVWGQLDLQVCYLTEQYRSGDDRLVNLLNEIRTGEVSDSTQDMLYEKLESGANNLAEGAIRLFTHNIDVETENIQALEQIASPVERFYATTRGSQTVVESLRKSVMAPDVLELKLGAQVMFVKNNPDVGYMNGTLGTVEAFTPDGWPVVQCLAGDKIVAKPMDWQVIDEFGKVKGSYAQVPLRLAWAITVHKSQGMTLDEAMVDLSKTFEPGQGYVALSRVKSYDGLILKGANSQAFAMDPLVMKADDRLRELSENTERGWLDLEESTLKELHNQFVFRAGGTETPQPVLISEKYEPEKPKISTLDQTKHLIEKGLDLQAIVLERELATSTIITHLGRLRRENPDLDMESVMPEKSVLLQVQQAYDVCRQKSKEADFDSNGDLKIGLIHRELKGQLDYEIIKWARVFIDSL